MIPTWLELDLYFFPQQTQPYVLHYPLIFPQWVSNNARAKILRFRSLFPGDSDGTLPHS